ncbi:N-acetylmuramoyl-L-alanine amidase family protein, partial [Listeria monocytogenes]|nr:N-acetylmuramoyl-L-alanine amidase family protein [Listeria monocytogenes]EDN9119127.1 N-acetylmuramoyl-L-alanine amidase family protein [Listeria monocytogenes]EDN9131110.1 N-acetylmuramoyl-L-alanine amidase family protein [Listeria monocytogenes]
MATVNGVSFRQNLVSSSKYGIKAPNRMDAKKITVHNTYNDATAQNETDYCKNNNNEVSFHVAVDDKEAIQVVPFDRNAWHCGDGGNGYGNRNTIGVE